MHRRQQLTFLVANRPCSKPWRHTPTAFVPSTPSTSNGTGQPAKLYQGAGKLSKPRPYPITHLLAKSYRVRTGLAQLSRALVVRAHTSHPFYNVWYYK